MSSIQNLQERVTKLERERGGDKPVVLLVVRYNGTDTAENHEVFTREEEAVLERHKAELIAAAKPGDRFVVVYWTKDKAQELLMAQAGEDPAPTTKEPPG